MFERYFSHSFRFHTVLIWVRHNPNRSETIGLCVSICVCWIVPMDQSESHTSFFVPSLSLLQGHIYYLVSLLFWICTSGLLLTVFYSCVAHFLLPGTNLLFRESRNRTYCALQNTAILWMREDKKTQVDFLCCSMFLLIQMSDKCNLFGFFLFRVIKYMALTLLWRTTITI